MAKNEVDPRITNAAAIVIVVCMCIGAVAGTIAFLRWLY